MAMHPPRLPSFLDMEFLIAQSWLQWEFACLGWCSTTLFRTKHFSTSWLPLPLLDLMVWIAILLTQMRFRRSLTKAQVRELGYRAPWWPYSSWFALAFILLVVVLMGFHEDARMALILGPCLLGVYLVMFYIVGLHRKTKTNPQFQS